jgi:hypothetical protein
MIIKNILIKNKLKIYSIINKKMFIFILAYIHYFETKYKSFNSKKYFFMIIKSLVYF